MALGTVERFQVIRDRWQEVSSEQVRLETQLELDRSEQARLEGELFELLDVKDMDAAREAVEDLDQEVAAELSRLEQLLDEFQGGEGED